MLFSITIAAQLPCLVKPDGPRWPLLALGAFMVGAIPSAWALPPGPATFLGGPITELFPGITAWIESFWPTLDDASALLGKASLLLAAFCIVIAAWVAQRHPKRGPRILLGCGAAVIAFIIARRLSVEMAIWPVIFSGLAFTYLWWLGILLFDLSFIWHRYIRRSVAIDTLLAWRHNEDVKPCSVMGLGSPQPRTSPAAASAS